MTRLLSGGVAGEAIRREKIRNLMTVAAAVMTMMTRKKEKKSLTRPKSRSRKAVSKSVAAIEKNQVRALNQILMRIRKPVK